VQVRLIESVTDKRAVRDEDVQRRRLGYKAAQARLAEVEAQLGLLKAGAWAPDIAVAKSEVAQAESQVKMAETNIDRRTMRAPIAGVILQNKVRLGQFAQCGPLSEPLMILGSVTPLHVRVDVDEHDAWRVRGGAPAAASPRGNGSIRIPLEFVRFEPYVIPRSRSPVIAPSAWIRAFSRSFTGLRTKTLLFTWDSKWTFTSRLRTR